MPNNFYWWGIDIEKKKILLFTAVSNLTETWRVPKAIPELENSFFSIKIPARGCVLLAPRVSAALSDSPFGFPGTPLCSPGSHAGILNICGIFCWSADFNQLSVLPDWNGALQGGAWSVKSAQSFLWGSEVCQAPGAFHTSMFIRCGGSYHLLISSV